MTAYNTIVLWENIWNQGELHSAKQVTLVEIPEIESQGTGQIVKTRLPEMHIVTRGGRARYEKHPARRTKPAEVALYRTRQVKDPKEGFVYREFRVRGAVT